MSNFFKNATVLLCLLALVLPVTVQAETLSIPGTGDGTAVLRALAAAYSMQNPELQIDIPSSIGSGGGIKAVASGEAILARVARELKPEEQKAGLSYLPFARVPAVFFTTRDIPIEYLSSQQICDIYSGKISNWQQVGGPDLPIRVIRREDGDSTLTALLNSFPGFNRIKITDHALLAKKTPEVFSLMAEKSQAIGFGPYDVAKNSDVQIIKIDGRDPTFAGYPSITTLAFVYQQKRLTAPVNKFLEFATSAAANLPIIAAGGIPEK